MALNEDSSDIAHHLAQDESPTASINTVEADEQSAQSITLFNSSHSYTNAVTAIRSHQVHLLDNVTRFETVHGAVSHRITKSAAELHLFSKSSFLQKPTQSKS